MARIRSVHPGLFTDDCFITLSMTARLLMIGLWTEADDQGVFEWKPATLKVRIFPADNMDIEAALAELETSGVILAFQVGQKKYGAVRNFRKFQRPKSPKAVHPLPDPVCRFVGLCSDEPAPVTAEVIQFPQKGEIDTAEVTPILQNGEIAPQMEDGGGKRKEEERKKDAACAAPDPRIASDPGEKPDPTEPERELFRHGKTVLGANAGGLIKNLLAAKKGSVPLARAALEVASTKASPREYIGAIIRGNTEDPDRDASGVRRRYRC